MQEVNKEVLKKATVLAKMHQKIDELSNMDLKTIWHMLVGYDPKEFYDQDAGITMDEWAQAIYSEVSMRGGFDAISK